MRVVDRLKANRCVVVDEANDFCFSRLVRVQEGHASRTVGDFQPVGEQAQCRGYRRVEQLARGVGEQRDAVGHCTRRADNVCRVVGTRWAGRTLNTLDALDALRACVALRSLRSWHGAVGAGRPWRACCPLRTLRTRHGARRRRLRQSAPLDPARPEHPCHPWRPVVPARRSHLSDLSPLLGP